MLLWSLRGEKSAGGKTRSVFDLNGWIEGLKQRLPCICEVWRGCCAVWRFVARSVGRWMILQEDRGTDVYLLRKMLRKMVERGATL